MGETYQCRYCGALFVVGTEGDAGVCDPCLEEPPQLDGWEELSDADAASGTEKRFY